MPENEFEKQVQQKMEELKLDPSSAVWENIEQKIKKEKRHRRGIFFLPILLISLLVAGYFIWSSTDLSKQKYQPLSQSPHAKKSIINKTQPTLTPMKDLETKVNNENLPTESGSLNYPLDRKILSQKAINIHLKKTSQLSFTGTSKVKVKIINPNTEISQNDSPVDLNKNLQDENSISSIDTSNKTELNKDSIKTNPDVTDSILTGKSTQNNKRKFHDKNIKKHQSWVWGINLSGGLSSITNNLLASDEKSNVARDFTNFPGTPGTPFFSPSKIKSSAALTTGVFIEKNIALKKVIRLGLNYKLFSSTNKIHADSISYSSSFNSKNIHHNYFHLIELPVSLQVQIGNSKKLLLSWDVGISVSQLIGSNALQFHSASGDYYHDNSLFNKTYLNFNTGFSVSLFPKQKPNIFIGPYINYDVSKIAKEGLYKNKHFTSIELRAQFMFRKK